MKKFLDYKSLLFKYKFSILINYQVEKVNQNSNPIVLSTEEEKAALFDSLLR